MIGRKSKYILSGMVFLFIFAGVLLYGPQDMILVVIGDLIGVLLVYLVWIALDNIADRVHEGIYWRLGLDLVYDFLKGVRGRVRQFVSIFMLISIPLFALNPQSSKEFFWRVIVPVDITTTLAVMYLMISQEREKEHVSNERDTKTNLFSREDKK